uniref:F-box domain-containing protein n=1 Tax=Plectus sambesii TaxID=2011161 RepID=A0A914UXI1_9BILA
MSAPEGEESGEEAAMLQLPDELAEKILGYLQLPDVLVLERTCRWWFDAAVLYWRKITVLDLVTFLRQKARLDIGNAFRFDAAASGLIKRTGPYLKSLDISRFGPLEYGLRICLEEAILNYCTKLECLKICNRLLDRQWLIKLFTVTGKQLRSLSMSHLYIKNEGSLQDELLGVLLENCSRLETLILSDNPKISLSCHTSFPSSLRVIDVQGCIANHRHLTEICKRCDRLESLRITYGKSTMLLPAQLLNKLTDLRIDGNAASVLMRMEDAFAADIAALTHLRSLTVSSNLVTDGLIEQVTTALLGLECLSVPGQRPPLDVLNISTCIEKLGRLPKLKEVSMKGNSPFGQRMLLLAHHLRALEHLDLSFAVKERDMVGLWDLVKSPHLVTLAIRGFVPPTRPMNAIATSLVAQLRPNCPCLIRVTLW